MGLLDQLTEDHSEFDELTLTYRSWLPGDEIPVEFDEEAYDRELVSA